MQQNVDRAECSKIFIYLLITVGVAGGFGLLLPFAASDELKSDALVAFFFGSFVPPLIDAFIDRTRKRKLNQGPLLLTSLAGAVALGCALISAVRFGKDGSMAFGVSAVALSIPVMAYLAYLSGRFESPQTATAPGGTVGGAGLPSGGK